MCWYSTMRRVRQRDNGISLTGWRLSLYAIIGMLAARLVRFLVVLVPVFVLLSPGSTQEVFSPPPVPERFVAVPTQEEIVVDGRLDEKVWQDAELIDGFIQKDPEQGRPSTYRTQVRVVYDETSLYIAAICE